MRCRFEATKTNRCLVGKRLVMRCRSAACQVGNEQASPFFVKGCDHPIDGSMLFSSGTLGRFSTILTGTLANPSMYCSGHNNLPPLRLPREGKLIIPETFKLFPDIS